MLRQHKKLTKRELKKDPFVIFTAQALDYLREEGVKIAVIIVTVVVVAALGIFLVKGRKKSEISAYDAALIALQNNAPEAPALLNNVADKYSGSLRAADALLRLGNLHFQQKDYDLAEKYYQRYVDKYAGDPLSDYAAYNSLGVVYEQKKEYAKAAGIYEEFNKKHANSTFNNMMLIAAGKAYWLAGDKQSAKKSFDFIAGQQKDSREKDEALYYLEMLDLNTMN